jgi:hypothetical protein
MPHAVLLHNLDHKTSKKVGKTERVIVAHPESVASVDFYLTNGEFETVCVTYTSGHAQLVVDGKKGAGIARATFKALCEQLKPVTPRADPRLSGDTDTD